MTKRRRILVWAVASLVLLVVGLGFYGGVRWQQFKRDLGIVTLDLSGVRLTFNHLAVQQIVVIRQPSADERLAVNLDSLRLEFADGWRLLPLRSLNIERLDVRWQPAPSKDDDQSLTLPNPQQLKDWSAWLPRQGQITSLELTSPCASGTCQAQGQLGWQLGEQAPLPATLDLQLDHQTHRLALALQAYEQGSDTHLDLALQLDGQQRLSMQNQMTDSSGSTLWRGTLAMNELPEAPWLLDWLSEWLAYSPPALPALPEQMRIGAGWALQIDTQALPQDWKALNGELRLSANLPAPWPVVGLGQVQGHLDLSARADDGLWIPTELAGDLTLLPVTELFAALPAPLRPRAVSLKIIPTQTDEAAQGLAVNVQLAASSPSPMTLDTRLVLQTAAPYKAAFDQTQLKLRSAAITGTDFSLKGLEADLRLNGELSQQDASIRLRKGSRLKLNSLTVASDLTASTLLMELAGLGAEAGFSDAQIHSLAVTGKTAIAVGEVKQPALRPQGWRWSGTLNADQSQISLDGPLGNDAGISLPLQLTHNRVDSATRLNITLPELFLRAGNPLAETLADWPPLLELNTGRLQGQAQLDVPGSGAVAASAKLSAKGLGGIYDRTELSGLDAELSAVLRRNQLRLGLTELTLREANPGFTFGPLRFAGEYAAPLDTLAQGRLAWSIAEVRLLGGRLWLEPGVADLGSCTQQLKAHLRGLQLPLLLEAYPAEGLSGTGVIDGELQLQRSEAGISIEQGSLQAREPGGALQFRSPKIQALGQANPAMRLVTEALDDFHYDLLASDVHYAADGTLDLGLKLHGRNPALEGGRPINFSINLEENIPALLTSLQLSDRVSETIQRRVQERLR
ncbi:intermembrane phospholipid transport protein YdbH family protein [Stutzerimonas xanthomarina]|uniref:intermembrane phospholipid transport protein YdbH family protein n=1 Tax=Stutzerimonas xanthomarina TaxID=271420 RepID=UPI003AA91981